MHSIEKFKIAFAFATVVFFSGCALINQPGTPARAGAVTIESIKGAARPGQIVPMSVSRSQLKTVLAKGSDLNQLRVVQITQSSTSSTELAPEYRLFGIKPGSVSDILGLQNADVLIAASGYVVFSPNQFADYLHALSELKAGSVQIRRGEDGFLLQYSIID